MKEIKNCPATVQVIDSYFPTVDGVVRTVHNYAKNLNKLAYTCVVAPDQDKNYKDEFSYDVIRAKSVKFIVSEYKLPMPSKTKAIKDTLDNKDIKIIHCHSPFLLGHYALKEGHKRGIKVISTFHSKYYDDVLKITHSRLCANIVVKYIVNFYNKCDAVWSCSKGTANTLRDYGYKGDIFVMDNGTDYIMPDNHEEIRKLGREKLGIEGDTPTLLFVGHQIWQKNLKLVLDTAKELVKRNFAFKMIIVGSGYAASEIQKYAEDLELSDHVTFIERVLDKPELQELELSSDLFFFPSIYDNAPLVVRESAAMHLPSLLMEGSNAAEPTADEYNAYHCVNSAPATARKIMKIFSNRKMLAKVGENASKTISKNWIDLIPEIVDEYNKVLDR